MSYFFFCKRQRLHNCGVYNYTTHIYIHCYYKLTFMHIFTVWFSTCYSTEQNKSTKILLFSLCLTQICTKYITEVRIQLVGVFELRGEERQISNQQ